MQLTNHVGSGVFKLVAQFVSFINDVGFFLGESEKTEGWGGGVNPATFLQTLLM